MKILGLFIFVVLSSIAALHFYWATGGVWPGESEQELVNIVIGHPAMTKMPMAVSTSVVAALILMLGFVGLAASGFAGIRPHWFIRLAAFGAGLVFTARGVGGYFFDKIAWDPVEPFATLNRIYFSPLCIVIGVIFFALALNSHKKRLD